MADKRSDATQIAQDTLEVAAQAQRTTLVDGSGVSYSAGFSFFRNGVSTFAVLDTTTASNNRPAPVVALAGDSLGPYSVNSGATDATTQRVVANIQRAGSELDYGAGNASTGTFRVVVAADQSALPVTLADVTRARGLADANTLRVTLATDDGFATETTLSALNTKVPANLTVTATRLLVDGSGVTQPISGSVSVSSSALPTGAATEAKQDTGNSSLASIDSKLTAPLSVTGPLTDAQLRASAVPVSATSLPLPSGAATEATLASIDTKTPALGQAAMAASTPVVIASNQSSINTLPQNVLQPFVFDYIAFTYNTTDDVIVYKTGGSGGTTVATVTVTYTDATKVDILNVART